MQYKLPPIFWFTIAFLLAMGVWSYFWWEQYGLLPEKVKDLSRNVELLSEPKDTAKNRGFDLQKLDLKIDKTEQSIREDFDWLEKIGLPLTLIGFVLMFWSVYKSALGFALKNAKESINKAYLPDEEIFKRERRILVLTKKGGDSEFVRKFLHQTGFLSAATIPDNLEKLDKQTLHQLLDKETFDLIFFNNEKVPFTNAEIKICADDTKPFTMLFSFGNPEPEEIGKQGKLSDDLVALPRVASANFKSQVYGNLINALKYQKYLR
jgi:hypothetical protein